MTKKEESFSRDELLVKVFTQTGESFDDITTDHILYTRMYQRRDQEAELWSFEQYRLADNEFIEKDVREFIKGWKTITGVGANSKKDKEPREKGNRPASKIWSYLNQETASMATRRINKIREDFICDIHPLKPAEASRWLEEREAAPGEGFSRLEIIISRNDLKGGYPDRIKGHSVEKETVEMLPFKDERGKPRNYSCSAELLGLKRACASLSDRLGWPLVAVVDLVLTGRVPESSIWMVRELKDGRTPTFTMRGSLKTEPAEVERFYREVRKRSLSLFEKISFAQLSPKNQHHRTALLVSFVQSSEGTWAARLELWNDRYPDMKYASVASMKTAYSRAKN